MSQNVQSAITGLALAVLTLLVSLGVIGPDKVDAWQAVVIALVTLVATVGVRSALPPTAWSTSYSGAVRNCSATGPRARNSRSAGVRGRAARRGVSGRGRS